jgi:hypothetical protein
MPSLKDFPKENSTIINGMDQMKRKSSQGMRKEPPDWPARRGNLQILPVPMAIPMAANKKT